MKIKKINRYYCDHCGKGHFHRTKAVRHEQGCTSNKERICGVCTTQQVPLKELFQILDKITVENRDGITLALKLKANFCPACILTAIRHHPRTGFTNQEPGDLEDTIIRVDFNYKEMFAAWRKEESLQINQRYHFNQ